MDSNPTLGCMQLGLPYKPSRVQIWGSLRLGGSESKGRQQLVDFESSYLSAGLGRHSRICRNTSVGTLCICLCAFGNRMWQ